MLQQKAYFSAYLLDFCLLILSSDNLDCGFVRNRLIAGFTVEAVAPVVYAGRRLEVASPVARIPCR